MDPGTLADLLLFIHLLFIVGVVLPVPLIILGKFLHWTWVRNFFFRTTHILMVASVVLPDLLGYPCPLTVWEQDLRIEAGEGSYQGDLIIYWLDRLVFPDLSFEAFTLIYAAFGLLILALYFMIPPRWPRKGKGPLGKNPKKDFLKAPPGD
jgi:hypothetical protein